MKRNSIVLGLAWLAMSGLSATAFAEGSAEVGANQGLQASTELLVDIVNVGETVTWTGVDEATVTAPGGGTTVLDSGESFTSTVAGPHGVTLASNQGGAWDIGVNPAGGGAPILGRLFSTRWVYRTGSFNEAAAANGSYYALVSGGSATDTGVVELRLDGLSGFAYNIGANDTGVAGINAGRSVSTTGNSFTPEYRLYVNPPELATYSTIAPTISNFTYTGGVAGCDQIVSGVSIGQFAFDANVEGTYHLICDTSGDGQFNRVDNDDLLLVGAVSAGTNTIDWDGTDSAGNTIPVGSYDCVVSLNIGELHYVGEDIETSFEGLRMFSVAANGDRAGLSMFWNDTAIQGDVVSMPNGDDGLETSGAAGIASGATGVAAVPNGNARSWGNFTGSTKGDNNLLDTFANLDSTLSATFQVQAVNGTDDCDNDGLTDFVEACDLGSAVCPGDVPGGDARDTDGDGVCDGAVAVAGVCIAGPDSDPLDANVCADADGDTCDDCDSGTVNPADDGDDFDGDGDCNDGDADDDDDGVNDIDDVADLDPAQCRDTDADNCDDCSSGTDDPLDDGTDGDFDGICNLGEDADGDGVIDVDDLDDDNDGILDSRENLLGVDPDADNDNDGIANRVDATDRGDGVAPDCSDTGNDGFCDSLASEFDQDGDGIENHLDLDADNDGILDVVEAGHGAADVGTNGVLDCAGGFGANGFCDALETSSESGIPDFNGDGVGPDATDNVDADVLPDFLDLDSDADGIGDLEEGGSGCADGAPADSRCDGGDTDSDGIVNSLDGAPGFGDDEYAGPTDTDSDNTPDYQSLDSDGDTILDLVEGDSGCVDNAAPAGTCDGADGDGDGLADDAAASTPDQDVDTHDDYQDLDSDNDGLLDSVEGTDDADGDGFPNYLDLDSDNDGIADTVEGDAQCADVAPRDGRCDGPDSDGDGVADDASGNPVPDTDGDGTPDYLDLDSDNDGASDLIEGGAQCADLATANSVCDGPDGDDDGLADDAQLGSPPDFDADGVPDYLDLDSDNDGLFDTVEVGSGCADVNANAVCDGPDGDGDGIVDSIDAPALFGDSDPATPPNSDGVDGPDYIDLDSDDDGTGDSEESGCEDAAPADDVCDGVDGDGDGVVDPIDGFDGFGVGNDTDGDGVNDGADLDDDNDGIPDVDEGDGNVDTDGDGVADSVDLDSDNDGIPDVVEAGHGQADSNGDGSLDCASGVGGNGLCDSVETSADSGELDLDGDGSVDAPIDSDGDGVPDFRDLDSDNDGTSDRSEGGATCADTDDNGVCDAGDSDGDGVVDSMDATDGFGIGGYGEATDTDGDGIPDYLDLDSDADGIADVVEGGYGEFDVDGDGTVDGDDTDGDGIKDNADGTGDFGGASTGTDTDGDGTPDQQETDSDDDGVDDAEEAGEDPSNPDDTDGDGRPDFQDTDSDDDGILDGSDNCRVNANADQFDEDSDGAGQVCDSDDDGDGFDDGLGVSGGGCSSGGTGTGALALVLLVLALAGLRRRKGAASAAILALLLVSSANVANAQSSISTEYNVERFRLASDTEGVLDVEWAGVPKHMEFGMALWLGYANDPLNVYATDDDGQRNRVGALVSDRLGGSIVGNVGITGRFALGIDVPVVLDQGQDIGGIQMSPSSIGSFGLGDIRLIPKVAVLRQRDAGVHLGFALGFTLPTSSEDDYFGESTASLAPEILLARSFESGLRLAANLGYRYRKESQALNLTIGDEIYSHAGVGYRFAARGGPPLEVDVTYAVATGANELFGQFNQNYSEAKIGASYDIPGPLVAFAATGRGTTEGFGAPDWRALLGVRFQRESADTAQADRLLIVASESANNSEPSEPSVEDKDVAGDADGDGLGDDVDGCPLEAEDMDGFEDGNGCPDPDNDGDSVLDGNDECINEPGVVSMAGCPLPDRDGDTVADAMDGCPDEPGTVEFNGCNKRQLVNLDGGKLDILDRVFFKTNKAVIRNVSFELLDNVAMVIINHPEIAQIRVEGHTDDRGSDAYNKKLSQSRAESVVRYLIRKGVKKSRLVAKGFGEVKPIESNESDEGRTANRRVEFVIVGGAPGVEVKNSGPGTDTLDGK